MTNITPPNPERAEEHRIASWVVALAIIALALILHVVLVVSPDVSAEEISGFQSLINLLVIPAVTALVVYPKLEQVQRNTNGSLTRRLQENAELSAERTVEKLRDQLPASPEQEKENG